MMNNAGPVRLPSIPSLPPINISDPLLPTASSHSPSASASLSRNFSARQSFSTLESHTPPNIIPPNRSPNLANYSSNNLSRGPSPPLRKSLSIDGFARNSRDGPSTFRKTTRPHTSIPTPDSRNSPRIFGQDSLGSFDIPPSSSRSSPSFNARVQTSHEPGGSALRQDNYDSDVERSNVPGRASIMSRRSSTKAKEPTRKLTPRTAELAGRSRSNTVGSIGGNIPRPENAHRLRSNSTIQSSQKHANIALSALAGRPRSGSLGMTGPPVPGGARYTPAHTDGASSHAFKPNSEITFAVVGSVGCGKSTAIHNGLNRFGLTDPTILSAPPGLLGANDSSTYTRRIGLIPRDEHSLDRALHVLEIQVPLDFETYSVAPPSRIWPETLPRPHSVIICYDASQESSFRPVETLLKGFRDLKLPTVVLACKSDLERIVEPIKALDVIKQYDVGLVEVSTAHFSGKERVKQAFDFLLTTISRDRPNTRGDIDANYRNPASPDVLTAPAWQSSRSPTNSSSMTSMYAMAQSQASLPPAPLPPPPLSPIHSGRSPSAPTSPARARSTNDLLSEHERAKTMERQLELERSVAQTLMSVSSLIGAHKGIDESREDAKEIREPETRPAQWATLDELLDKLIFLAVTGDDPTFISHFLLTYRRFASPRSIILAMQRRLRQLDSPAGDPMFACFGQMRICHLLEVWIRDYPHDFAVRGTAGALSALIKSILGKTYLLHYGSDFLPFLELLPSLTDKDAAWALKVEDAADESDDSRSLFDDDEDSESLGTGPESSAHTEPSLPSTTITKPPTSTSSHARERKPSLPQPRIHTAILGHESGDASMRQLLKDLLRVAHEVNMIDSEEIALEITRVEARMFLDIEPRHWLQYTFAPGKKNPETDTIARFNRFSNSLAAWVVSLILCHDKPRARAKQIEKFVEVAFKLRALNNYSALRAFVAGINNSTFPTDPTMEIFKQRAHEAAKNLQSWDLLFQFRRSHRAYRMALRNSKGACIPALEVHMSDLIQAHEGNVDSSPAHPGKVHWGKYNMIGKFISTTTQCQDQCRITTDYDIAERPRIAELLQRERLMDEDMQKSRISPPDADGIDDGHRPALPRTLSKDNPNGQGREVFRKIIFW